MFFPIVFLQLMSSASPGCPTEVSYEQALQRMGERPSVRSAETAANAWSAAAQATPPWTGSLSASVEPAFRGWPQNQMGPEGALEVRHTFLLSGAASSRQDVTRLAAQAAREGLEVSRFRDRLQLLELFTEVELRQDLLALARQEQKLADEFVTTLQKARALGETLDVDFARATAFAAQLELSVTDQEGGLYEAQLALSDLLECQRLGGLQVRREISEDVVEDDVRLPSSLARTQVEREGAALQQLDDEAASSLGVGLRIEADGPGTARGMALVSWQWPLFEDGHVERAAQRAQLHLAEARALQQKSTDAHLLSMALHEVEHTAEVLMTLQQKVCPALEQTADLELRAFQAGQTTSDVVMRAQAAALSARRQRTAATVAHRRAVRRLRLVQAASGDPQ